MSPLWIAVLTISLGECLVAFYLNAFIVLITRRSLGDGVTSNLTSLIHLIIGVTNISMCIWVVFDNVASWSEVVIFYYLTTFLMYFHLCFSYWLMAWLSTNYCTTITTTQHRLFICIKKMLSMFLPHVLALTAAGSLAVSLAETANLIYFSMNSKLHNTTTADGAVQLFSLNTMLAVSLSGGLPCLVILISLMVTVSSLLKHVWNMNRAASGSARPSSQVHINAVKTMILFLLLGITFCVMESIYFTVSYTSDNPITVICWMTIMVFPAAEAAIIIQSSPKLRKIFLERHCARQLDNDQN